MARQYSTALRDAWNNVYESTIGASAVLEIRTGPPPADTAAAASGTLLVSITLPADWQSASASGATGKIGTWSGTAAGTGTAGYYRLKASGGTAHEQGTVTVTGGGGDLTLDNTSIAAAQPVAINSWSRTAPGA